MRNRSLDAGLEQMNPYSLMKEDILAEAERIRLITIPEKIVAPRHGSDRRRPKLSFQDLLALDDIRFVEAAYEKLLCREMDLEGGSTYLAGLRAGRMTKDEVLFLLSMSDEGRQCGVSTDGVYLENPKPDCFMPLEGGNFIEALYCWLLGRKPDETGLKDYEKRLAAGEPKQALYEAVCGSEERRRLVCRTTKDEHEADGRTVEFWDLMQFDDAAFVANVFRKILGREADPASASNWLIALRNGVVSKAGLVFEISISQEGIARGIYINGAYYDGPKLSLLAGLKGSDFIRGVFMWVLGRAVDDVGMAYYRSLMRQGKSKRQILDIIANSQEAVARRESSEYAAVSTSIQEDLDDGRRIERLAATMAEYDVREIVSKYRTEEAVKQMQAYSEKHTQVLHYYTALNELRQRQAEAQLASLYGQFEEFQQQLERTRHEAQEEIARVRTEAQEEIARVRTEAQNEIVRIGQECANQSSLAEVNATSAISAVRNETHAEIERVMADKANAAQVEKLTADIGAVARQTMLAKWKIIDHLRGETERGDDVLTCNICGESHRRDEYKTMETDCIFNGGHLTRYICPNCGVVFGPSKFVDQGQKGIDEDYWVHYLGFSEGDSEYKEERAFRLLEPTKDRVYLNYGCGKWSGTLQKLRAEGYDVYGYEPYAPETDNPCMITRKEDLMKMRFDGIFSNDMLEHLIDPIEDMKFMKGLLLGKESRMAHCTACYSYKYEYKCNELCHNAFGFHYNSSCII